MNTDIKRHIDSARQVLVGVVPNPSSQIDQITYALIYKFMDDMDQAAIKNGDEPAFFIGDLEPYSWARLMDSKIGNQDRMNLYVMAFQKFAEAKQLPELFRNILRSAFLPYRSPETLDLFLKEIDYFNYSHPEELGNAYEYLLSIMSSQGDAGQFRTPRHIIDFIVEVVNPSKDDKILDPACGTAGFLISSYKHILLQHDGKNDPEKKEKSLTPDQRRNLMSNFEGYDIDPSMVRIAQVNMYLHQFKNPKIFQYDSLSSDERWNDKFDVILANPPFMSPKGGIKPHNKFSISSSRSEVLFVDYIMNHLRPMGRAGIIVPEGVIFQSGTTYKQLRKNLVEDGLYAVISLPSGVFAPYSGVKTSILLFNNELAKKSKEVLFVKIDQDGFDLGAQRRLIAKNDLPQTLQEIQKYQQYVITGKATSTFTERIEKDSILNTLVIQHDKYILVKKSHLAENGNYNLSGDQYRVAIDYCNTKWPMVKLEAVCELHRGVIYSKQNEVSSDGHKILRANNISLDNRLKLDAIKLISKEIKLKDSQKLRSGDIFICLASGSKDHIGKVAYIDTNTDFYFGGFMGAVRIKNENIISSFLFHLLKDDKFNDFLRREISGANINNLNFGILSRYKIPLPPIEIQRQIVEELDGYMNIITGAKQIVQNWKPKIDIDPEWKKVSLEQIADITAGQSPEGKYYNKNAEGTPFYQGKTEFQDIYLGDPKMWTRKITKLADKNDILMSVRAPVGPVNISLSQVCIGRGLAGIRAKEIEPIFLFTYLQMIEKEIVGSGGAVFNSITKKQIGQIKIPIPSSKTQKEIVIRIEAERALVDSSKKLIKIYEQKTRDTISKLWGE